MLPVLWRALAMRRLRLEKHELEGRIRERTAELEATNEELDAFTHSVSHDLRAPLRAISGFTTILLEHHAAGMTAEVSRLLGMVATNAGRMERLIEDLLRLARMGLEPLTHQPVNIAVLVREVLGELAPEQAGRRIELTVGELPDCAGDAALLKQVFVNLLANAFKFTRQREAPRI
jgi:signal transduction histidine kinase